MCCCVHCTYSAGGVEKDLFLPHSLSLFTGIQHALQADTTYKVLVKTALSVLWPYKMHIFLNPFHVRSQQGHI